MKITILKRITSLLLVFGLVGILITSCEKKDVIVPEEIQEIIDNTPYQKGEAIESTISPEEFEDFLMTNGNNITYEQVENFLLTSEELVDRSSNCSTCEPWLSDINETNIGGNDRIFGVNGGRNFPCSYNLTWKIFGGAGVITNNWGSIIRATFNNSGWVGVRLQSGTNGQNCYVYKYRFVNI